MARNMVVRCMGIEKYRGQCEMCRRLPDSVDDENKANTWYEPSGRNGVCGEYIERKQEPGK